MFIPIAEDTGLIAQIGRWVLQEAARQAALWHSDGRDIGMSVNVSGYQLDRDGLEQDVERVSLTPASSPRRSPWRSPRPR